MFENSIRLFECCIVLDRSSEFELVSNLDDFFFRILLAKRSSRRIGGIIINVRLMLNNLIPIFLFFYLNMCSKFLTIFSLFIGYLKKFLTKFFQFIIENLPKLNSQSYETISPNEIVFFFVKKLLTKILVMSNFCFIF